MSSFLTESRDCLRLSVQVVPRASRVRFGPVVGDRLKIQLTAPPVDGAANDALVRALADELDLPRSSITITAGMTGRKKLVELASLDEAARLRIRNKVLSWSQPA